MHSEDSGDSWSIIHTLIFFEHESDESNESFLLVYDIAAMRSVSLRLQSLNQKTLTEYHRFITESFTRICFLIFLFDFRLIYILISV